MTHPPATADVIDAFVLSVQATNGSPKYISKLRHTLGFLARACPDLPTTTAQLDTFLASLHDHRTPYGRPLSDTTLNEIRLSVKRMYAWISDRYPGAANPAARLRKTRIRAKLPRVLSADALSRLLDANQHFPRENAMLHVMLDTMARLGELTHLTWSDIATGSGGAEIHFPDTGKQGARSAPINPDTLRALRLASHHGPLWQKTDGEPLTYYGVRRAFRNALARAGLRGNPHLMRHTAATDYVRNGGDLFSLMRIGGWSTLKAVQIYVHLANTDVRDQHLKHSTIARRAARGGTQLTLLQEAQ